MIFNVLQKKRWMYHLFVFVCLPIMNAFFTVYMLWVNSAVLNVAYNEVSTNSTAQVATLALVNLICFLLLQTLNQYLQNKEVIKRTSEGKKNFLEHTRSIQPISLADTLSGDFLQAIKQVEVLAGAPKVHANMLKSILTIVGTTLFVSIVSGWKVLSFLLVFLFFIVVVQGLVSPLAGKQEDIVRQEGKSISALREILSELDTVKSYQVEKSFAFRYAKTVKEEKYLYSKKEKYVAFLTILQKIIQTLSLTLLPAVTAIIMTQDGTIELSMIVVVSFAFFGLGNALSDMMQAMQQQQEMKAAQGIVNTILDKPIVEMDITIACAAQKSSKNEGLRIQEIFFSYENKNYILNGLSAVFPDTGLVEIRGANGSGKSTLFSVLSGVSMESCGVIFWKGNPLSQMKRSMMISYMPQQSLLFSLTVRENIEIANEEKPEEELEAFLNKLGILELFVQFENGLDTQLENDGSDISGGQAKLISFCRAARKETSVLILDEPFSEVDQKTIPILFNACRRLASSKLVLFTNHDLKQQTKMCYEMDKGRLFIY